MTFIDVSLAKNIASSERAAVGGFHQVLGSSATVTDSEVTKNEAASPLLAVGGIRDAGVMLTLTNTDVENNMPIDCEPGC